MTISPFLSGYLSLGPPLDDLAARDQPVIVGLDAAVDIDLRLPRAQVRGDTEMRAELCREMTQNTMIPVIQGVDVVVQCGRNALMSAQI